jgi:lipoyl(octanoyl) transferase
LSHFELIVPCGIREAGVTSMREELGRDVDQREVEERIAHHFREVFDCEVTRAPEPGRTVSVVVRRDDGRVLLLKRTEARGGFWQPVTGHVEAGESPEQAAQRELREETGATATVKPLNYEHAFCVGGSSTIVRETAFVAHSNELVKRDADEHSEAAWFSVDEAIALVPFAGLKRAVQLSARA